MTHIKLNILIFILLACVSEDVSGTPLRIQDQILDEERLFWGSTFGTLIGQSASGSSGSLTGGSNGVAMGNSEAGAGAAIAGGDKGGEAFSLGTNGLGLGAGSTSTELTKLFGIDPESSPTS